MDNRVLQIRKDQGITQEELANAVGVTRNYISAIENKKQTGNVRVLLRIAKVLNVKFEDIFLG